MELTKESLQKQLRANEEKTQNEFANKVLQDIQWWNEKANRKDYKPTAEENQAFIQVLNIVNGMNNTGLLAYIPE